ncbi:MAG: hypothetical protein CPSOU_5378 [uncultured Paraburkholderia sp.]|nr:MAG: hypothetical protein CPSOU_5378 [uncultured Paraburkholderia sp.]
MRQVFKMERQPGRRQPQCLGDFTGRHAGRAGDHQQSEDGKARFVGQRALMARTTRLESMGWHDKAFISIFQEFLKRSAWAVCWFPCFTVRMLHYIITPSLSRMRCLPASPGKRFDPRCEPGLVCLLRETL